MRVQFSGRTTAFQAVDEVSTTSIRSICEISSAGQSAWSTPKRSQVRTLYLAPTRRTRLLVTKLKRLQTQRGELSNARLEVVLNLAVGDGKTVPVKQMCCWVVLDDWMESNLLGEYTKTFCLRKLGSTPIRPGLSSWRVVSQVVQHADVFYLSCPISSCGQNNRLLSDRWLVQVQHGVPLYKTLQEVSNGQTTDGSLPRGNSIY